ncbi:hypothetical protein COU74_01195 [Candidatus Peregrinibacteria bacterium CG10_big_fil_rev_8_21_14_0_10_36_19]|nr:MAG: hypothetical protein COU74_01195 [Candidatus Peregrinibacteria bacterium CG10_big_fil_rev_8_21_14_0_10_36_19]
MDKLLSLGIDPWSMVIYLANTGLLLAVLTYLLYKPILKFLDERKEQIISSIEESQRLQETFEKKLTESEANRQEAEAELKEELSNLHKFTEQKRKELTAEMEEARNKMMEKAQQEIDAKKANLLKEAETEVKTLMTRIILEIVENKVPENVIQESIHSAWKQYSK